MQSLTEVRSITKEIDDIFLLICKIKCLIYFMIIKN